MQQVFSGFKAFLLRGNLIHLAVAFIIGLAFVNLVNSFVSNLITPVISMILGESSLRSLDFEINDSVFFYGAFLDDAIQFLAIAATVYFAIVLPYTAYQDRQKRGESEADATTKACPQCISTIPVEATRCAFCGQPV